MKTTKKTGAKNPAFELKTASFLPATEHRHVYGQGKKHIICVTDTKGYPHPDNKSIVKLRVDSSDGFIPLWDKDVTLNWRFNKSFSGKFKDGEKAKEAMRQLMGEAILAWKEACPIKFHENNDNWDFEIAMHNKDCDNEGCVLAESFFPDQGRHKLYIYPSMFDYSHAEQKSTIEHEMGHIFGLRHFFANISERDLKSELFGSKSSFTIMNYGSKSKLTPQDVKDLKHLYKLVWTGELTEINGTKIKKFVSYHMAK
jgi:hypothetical protein